MHNPNVSTQPIPENPSDLMRLLENILPRSEINTHGTRAFNLLDDLRTHPFASSSSATERIRAIQEEQSIEPEKKQKALTELTRVRDNADEEVRAVVRVAVGDAQPSEIFIEGLGSDTEIPRGILALDKIDNPIQKAQAVLILFETNDSLDFWEKYPDMYWQMVNDGAPLAVVHGVAKQAWASNINEESEILQLYNKNMQTWQPNSDVQFSYTAADYEPDAERLQQAANLIYSFVIREALTDSLSGRRSMTASGGLMKIIETFGTTPQILKFVDERREATIRSLRQLTQPDDRQKAVAKAQYLRDILEATDLLRDNGHNVKPTPFDDGHVVLTNDFGNAAIDNFSLPVSALQGALLDALMFGGLVPQMKITAFSGEKTFILDNNLLRKLFDVVTNDKLKTT